MRVEIKPRAHTRGILRKRKCYFVKVWVQFSEEERAIIKENNLEEDVVVERMKPGFRGRTVEVPLTFRTLMAGSDTFPAATRLEASNYIDLLKESLTTAKQYLEANTGGLPDETFEL